MLSAYDQKIEDFNEALNFQMEKLDVTQAHQDVEIAGLNKEVARCFIALDLKLSHQEA